MVCSQQPSFYEIFTSIHSSGLPSWFRICAFNFSCPASMDTSPRSTAPPK